MTKQTKTNRMFVVTHRRFVSEGNNYAGWAGEKEFTTVLHGEKALVEWLADVEAWNEPKLCNHPHTVLKVEEVFPTDVTLKMLEKGRLCHQQKQAAYRRMRAAELRAEARKIELGA